MESSLEKCILFQGMSGDEMKQLFSFHKNRTIKIHKDEFIFEEEDRPSDLFILLNGKIAIGKDTPSGNQVTITQIEDAGDMFGEVYMFLGTTSYQMYARAVKDSEVFVLSGTIFQEKTNLDSQVREKLKDNMLKIFAKKAFTMNQKIKILGGATLREKIARYLWEVGRKRCEILLPKREELAAYFNVTRPSLSRELSKMQQEGLIMLQDKKLKIINQEKLDEFL